MKYDLIYPDAKYLEQFKHTTQRDGFNIMKGREKKPCWHCGELTTWLDIDFQVHLCREECSIDRWYAYYKASCGKYWWFKMIWSKIYKFLKRGYS